MPDRAREGAERRRLIRRVAWARDLRARLLPSPGHHSHWMWRQWLRPPTLKLVPNFAATKILWPDTHRSPGTVVGVVGHLRSGAVTLTVPICCPAGIVTVG